MDLNRTQLDALKWIAQFWAAHRYAPTIRELGKALGLTSTNGALTVLARLIQKGLLAKTAGTPRTIVLTELGEAVVRGEAEVRVLDRPRPAGVRSPPESLGA